MMDELYQYQLENFVVLTYISLPTICTKFIVYWLFWKQLFYSTLNSSFLFPIWYLSIIQKEQINSSDSGSTIVRLVTYIYKMIHYFRSGGLISRAFDWFRLYELPLFEFTLAFVIVKESVNFLIGYHARCGIIVYEMNPHQRQTDVDVSIYRSPFDIQQWAKSILYSGRYNAPQLQVSTIQTKTLAIILVYKPIHKWYASTHDNRWIIVLWLGIGTYRS